MRLPCESCAMRRRAEAKPDSFIAKLWRWHTRWCPGWKAYQRQQQAQSRGDGNQTDLPKR